MTKRHINASYARLDPAHVFDGLFVPTKGHKRGRLDVPLRRFNTRSIGFRGFELLGADDQSILLAISAQLGINGLKISMDPPGQTSRQLRLDLFNPNQGGDDGADLGCKSTSLRSLLIDAGSCPKTSTNKVKEALHRLRSTQIREIDHVSGWDRVCNLISCSFNHKTDEVIIAANPRLTEAVFHGQHVRISLLERAALKTQVAKLLHCWLSSNVRLGGSLGNGRGAGVDTLALHIYGPSYAQKSRQTKFTRRTLIRDALCEIAEGTRSLHKGWAISVSKSGVAKVSRPVALPHVGGCESPAEWQDELAAWAFAQEQEAERDVPPLWVFDQE